ncbi:MAG: GNAT family N-acetyltransferase [Roseibium sp.]|nr:GNAT family N-acetyltransferase [Roseibium sp.]
MTALNAAAVPATNLLAAGELQDLIDRSLCCLVADGGDGPVGFLLCLGEGLSYDSPNYQWFGTVRARFAYTDRICVHNAARGQRIGERLYQGLFQNEAGTGRSFVCEVNERPPNPGSLRFHERLGFSEIGRQDHGEKAVIFMERPATAGASI